MVSLIACNQPFTLTELLEQGIGMPLGLLPEDGQVSAGESLTLTAVGGYPPYRYSVADGDGRIDETTGVFTAADSPGTTVVEVRDRNETAAQATVTVIEPAAPLAISPAEISVVVGATASFGADGGQGPYRFSLTKIGSGDPELSGESGAYTAGAVAGTDVVTVTDALGAVAGAVVTVSAESTGADEAPGIDYGAVSVHHASGFSVAGPVSGSFVYRNLSETKGTDVVFWRVVASLDAAYDAAVDKVVDAGEGPPLDGGADSGEIPFSGQWPRAAASYRLLLILSAGNDDNEANDTAVGDPISVTGTPPAQDVDYTPQNLSVEGVSSGRGTRGSFDLTNIAGDLGRADVFWSVYVSADPTHDSSDRILGQGRVEATPDVPRTVPNLRFAGTWFETPGRYYLFVDVSSGEDTNPLNDRLGPVQVDVMPADVNYVPRDLIFTAVSKPGEDLDASFAVDNIGADDGAIDGGVRWFLYVSRDSTYDPGTDRIVATDSLAGMAAGAPAVEVQVTDRWTEAPGTYYLIARLEAAEDSASGNDGDNVIVSDAITLAMPSVDYRVVSVGRSGDRIRSGSALSEDFVVENIGADDGAVAVSWYAYASLDEVYQRTDSLLATGTLEPLPAGARTRPPVEIVGTWPASASTYRIIVRLQSNDDLDTGNNTGAGEPVTVFSPATVDYVVREISRNYPLVGTNTRVSESLSLQNIGDTSGSADVLWRLYASVDNADRDAGDRELASGSLEALDAGEVGAPVWASASWPGDPGTYHLLLEIESVDEGSGEVGNNLGVAGPFVVTAPPNYRVDPPVPPGDIVQVNDQSAGSLRLEETNGNTGIAAVSWRIQVSSDPMPGGDTPGPQGTVGPPEGGSDLVVPYTLTWSVAPGIYHLVAGVFAADDEVSTDDVAVSPGSVVVADYLEVEPNNAAPPPPPNTPDDAVTILGPIAAGHTITVAGRADGDAGSFDSFKLTAVGDLAQVHARLEWDSGGNDFDLFLWHGSPQPSASESPTANLEPAAGDLSRTDVDDGEAFYVGVMALTGGGGPPPSYLLIIRAE